jgi:hypothetical protein
VLPEIGNGDRGHVRRWRCGFGASLPSSGEEGCRPKEGVGPLRPTWPVGR